MRQRLCMVKHGAEIRTIDPASAIRALHEMLGLVRRRTIELAEIPPARNLAHGSLTSYWKAAPSAFFFRRGHVLKQHEVSGVSDFLVGVDVNADLSRISSVTPQSAVHPVTACHGALVELVGFRPGIRRGFVVEDMEMLDVTHLLPRVDVNINLPWLTSAAPHENASLTRAIAGCVRFFTLIQCFDGPAR